MKAVRPRTDSTVRRKTKRVAAKIGQVTRSRLRNGWAEVPIRKDQTAMKFKFATVLCGRLRSRLDKVSERSAG